MTNSSSAVEYARVIYPESDGKPVGETEIHVIEFAETLFTLREFFQNHMDVYVAGNMFLYYEEGNPREVVCPDLFVVKGVSKEMRRIYKLWQEKVPPCFILEFTSRSTRLEDLGKKRALYADLGVKEYFLFDPLEEYLKSPLQGYRLLENEYLPIETAIDGSIISRELNIRLMPEGFTLRLYDAHTGEKLLRPLETAEARRVAYQQVQIEIELRHQAEHQARLEAEARKQADAEITRLRAEIERLQGK